MRRLICRMSSVMNKAQRSGQRPRRGELEVGAVFVGHEETHAREVDRRVRG